MKKIIHAIISFFICFQVLAQQNTAPLPGNEFEQQLENLSQQQENELEDDAYLQTLIQLQKNKLNLNQVNESELAELRLVTPLQIQNLIQYRRQLGVLVSIFELQAVPGWDLLTI